ncbi:hypothetical protein VULLAG_LOCUS16267 [Vulpes lagopus]
MLQNTHGSPHVPTPLGHPATETFVPRWARSFLTSSPLHGVAQWAGWATEALMIPPDQRRAAGCRQGFYGADGAGGAGTPVIAGQVGQQPLQGPPSTLTWPICPAGAVPG